VGLNSELDKKLFKSPESNNSAKEFNSFSVDNSFESA